MDWVPIKRSWQCFLIFPTGLLALPHLLSLSVVMLSGKAFWELRKNLTDREKSIEIHQSHNIER